MSFWCGYIISINIIDSYTLGVYYVSTTEWWNLGPRKKIADLDHDQSETGKHAVEKKLAALDDPRFSGDFWSLQNATSKNGNFRLSYETPFRIDAFCSDFMIFHDGVCLTSLQCLGIRQGKSVLLEPDTKPPPQCTYKHYGILHIHISLHIYTKSKPAERFSWWQGLSKIFSWIDWAVSSNPNPIHWKVSQMNFAVETSVKHTD